MLFLNIRWPERKTFSVLEYNFKKARSPRLEILPGKVGQEYVETFKSISFTLEMNF